MENFVKKIKCKLCNGSKVSMRLGGISGDCVECEGLGIVFDIQTEEEILQIENEKKLKLAQEKRAKKEKMINDIACRLSAKNPNISYDEAKRIAKEELEKQENEESEEKLIKENTEKSRKPRKKKEEIVTETKEETSEDLIDSL